uniref:Uncharacterized protein n=1 Tax=Oryza sativa subsp. japonica TaxID=39947 RepID=Q2QT34_ORYSJ|nr:hypothetical protein LOC_Os12g22010 [Oryza sativa Japonica Group]
MATIAIYESMIIYPCYGYNVLHLNQDLAYIFRQEVYGEAVVRSQVPPLIGNGCKHRQIRFTEKFFLGDTVVHKATLELEKKSGIARALQGRTSEKELLSLSLVPILFGLGNYKKLIRKGKQLILHGLNEVIPRKFMDLSYIQESEAVRLIKRRLLYLGPETIEEGSLLVLKVSPHSIRERVSCFDPAINKNKRQENRASVLTALAKTFPNLFLELSGDIFELSGHLASDSLLHQPPSPTMSTSTDPSSAPTANYVEFPA